MLKTAQSNLNTGPAKGPQLSGRQAHHALPEEDAVCATPGEIAKTNVFLALYSKWLFARAVCQDPTQPEDDEHDEKVFAAQEDAELQLMVAPAPTPWAVWIKWEVLELSLDDDYRTGIHSAARTVLMLAAVKADLIKFSFGI